MSVTRIIAIIAAGTLLGLAPGARPAAAQDLREATPPAELPPAGYAGKQYVDSRGCIYIRAGIDGAVTWVPRVNSERKQVCGFNPTLAGPAPTGPAPTASAADTAASASAGAAQPGPATSAAPARTVPMARPAAAAQPATQPAAQPAVQPAAQPATQMPPRPAPRRRAAPGPAQTARVIPQAAPVLVVGDRVFPANTRVVPRHVYDNRQNTRNVQVPAGYQPVWTDDRLNPHRAEFSLAPPVLDRSGRVPDGFRQVERKDNRLNPQRGPRSARGDAQSDAIWSRTVPRTLLEVPTDRAVVELPAGTLLSPAEAEVPLHLRLSTRSAPGTAAPASLAAPAPRTWSGDR